MQKDMPKVINVRGVFFDNVTFDEAFDIAKQMIETDGCSAMFTPNPEIVQNCKKDESFYDVLNNAELIIPDGIGVIYASKILKTPLKERVPGVEMAKKIVEYANDEGHGVYIFGGAKGENGDKCVAEIAADKLKEQYPDLVISGFRDGFFSDDESDAIVEDINNSGARILFVCLGSPKQEKWIHDNKEKLNVSFAGGLGGTVNIFAGTAKRAPKFFIKTNLEWFYRLLCQPSRIGRMMSLPKFLWSTLVEGNSGCNEL